MSVVVIGASGQLARHLQEQLPKAMFLGRSALDLATSNSIQPAIAAQSPSIIINAAAYTGVDDAEQSSESAWRINAEAPAMLARVAERHALPLIHVSTDYVFDGQARTDYQPNDAVNPLSIYGRSKLAGELAIRSLCTRYWILRTSWVFSAFGNNFVRTMLRVGADRDVLQIVSDQFGRPTYAGDLARVIAALSSLRSADRPPPGIYHAVGGPAVSWYAFAEAIFERAVADGILSRPPELTPIPTAVYPTPAPRPLRAVLAPSRDLLQATGTSMDWEAGLRQTVARLV